MTSLHTDQRTADDAIAIAQRLIDHTSDVSESQLSSRTMRDTEAWLRTQGQLAVASSLLAIAYAVRDMRG